MPRKFKRSRRRRRRNFRRSKKSYTSSTGGLGPLPPRFLTRMRYSQALSHSYLSGTTNDYIFRLNSIFDPDYTGAGHQPYAHDQFATFYSRYRVYKCSWRITFPSSNDTFVVTVVPTNAVTDFTDSNYAAEFPRAITKMTSYYGGGGAITFKGHISLARLNGSSKTQYRADDRFQAQFGSNPNETLDLHIVTSVPGGENVSVRPVVNLTYWVELWDPVNVAPS